MWAKKRIELGIPLDAFVLISVGELNVNKNNKVIIEALAKLHKTNVHYCLCGVGNQRSYLQTQADNAGLHDNVHFLGYRSDIKDLLLMADVYVMPSIREGLSRSIMEAMASGLPCVVSRIRGNTELIENSECGYLCNPNNSNDFGFAFLDLTNFPEKRKLMGNHNIEKIQSFAFEKVTETVERIYRNENM